MASLTSFVYNNHRPCIDNMDRHYPLVSLYYNSRRPYTDNRGRQYRSRSFIRHNIQLPSNAFGSRMNLKASMQFMNG